MDGIERDVKPTAASSASSNLTLVERLRAARLRAEQGDDAQRLPGRRWRMVDERFYIQHLDQSLEWVYLRNGRGKVWFSHFEFAQSRMEYEATRRPGFGHRVVSSRDKGFTSTPVGMWPFCVSEKLEREKKARKR